MSDPREIEALCAWLESFDDTAMQNARTLHYDMRARVVPALRALAAENERLASIIRECVYDGTEGGECEECGEPIRLDQTWRGDMNNRQWHTPTCADARAQVDDIVAMPRRERDALSAQLAAARADTERLDWLERRVRTVYDVSVIRCPDRETEPDDTLAGFGLSTSPKCIFQGTGDTLREAIDAAKGGA